MRGLLPHLDDAAPAVHGAVQRLLTTLGELNPALVRELLEVYILFAFVGLVSGSLALSLFLSRSLIGKAFAK